jgi:FkbM family methyltransferase
VNSARPEEFRRALDEMLARDDVDRDALRRFAGHYTHEGFRSALLAGLRLPAAPPARGIDPFLPALSEVLPPDPVVVEAGAYRGGDTRDFAELWPDGRMFALEPVPGPFAELRESTSGLPNVTAEQLALGSAEGTSTMWVSSGASDGSSSLREPTEHLVDHPDVAFEERVDVQVVTLDSYLARRGIDRIDLLWLDLQGSELEVLKASPRALSATTAIVTEVFFKELYDGAPLWPEVRSWLEGQGFRVAVEDFPWEDAGNALFVRGDAPAA